MFILNHFCWRNIENIQIKMLTVKSMLQSELKG